MPAAFLMSERQHATRPLPELPAETAGRLIPLPLPAEFPNRWAPAAPGPTAPGEPGEGALGSYLRAVRTHIVLVVAITVATGIAALAWGQMRTPSYEATAQMLITPISSDDTTYLGLPLVRDTGDPPRTLQTAATLIDSPRAAQLTARRLGGKWTQRRVEKAVNVSPEGQSSIVDVVASASSANQSAHVANAYAHSVIDARVAELKPLIDRAIATTRAQQSRLPNTAPSKVTLSDRIRQLQNVEGSDPTISVSQVASPPDSSSGISLPLVFIIALVAGAALGTIAALLLDLLRPKRMAEEEELLGLYRLPVLARIPNLPRRWRRQAPDSPLAMPPMVREGFRTLQVQLELQPGRHRSILVTSASSGDGKTTSAVNFALELVGAGQKVVLMDLDLRKPDIGKVLEISPRVSLNELLDPKTRIDQALVDAPGVAGLRVLPIHQGDGFTALERLTARLPELVAEALALADYVIIDTAPLGEVSDALKMVAGVDDVLVVSRLGNTRRVNYEVMRDLLERTRHTPTGLVVIGTSARVVSSYYYYGYGGGQGGTKSPVTTGS
jgi:Mrp family chromosome partitioning ATPase/capsular polysaccharide biosynthesis protein